MGDWAVRWFAVPIDGSSDVKWCAVTVSRDIADTAAKAIYAAQRVWDLDKDARLPMRAFVGWEASNEAGVWIQLTAAHEPLEQETIDFLRSRGVDPKPVEPRTAVINRDLMEG